MEYNEIINELVATANKHLLVKSANAGVLEGIDFGEVQYPLVFFATRPSNFTLNVFNLNISMIVGDIVDQEELQQITKQSNMLSIAKDILSYLINYDPTKTWDIDEDTIVATPFVDNFPDLAAGWQVDFTIRMQFNDSGCELPFTS